MRILAGALLVLVGMGAGWAMTAVTRPAETTPAPELPAATDEMKSAQADLQRSEEERVALAERYAALEQENQMLRNEQSMLEAALDDAATAPIVIEEEAPAAVPPATPENRARDRRPEPTPEQMAEFRKTQEEQRERMRERLDEELNRMGDPNAVQNFQTLLDYREDEETLRRKMRDAKTDAEREKIAEDMRATGRAARDLLNAQQDSMLRTLAASSGIKDAAAQEKFVQDFRSTLDNPFFAMEPMLVGGGRGPRGPWGNRPR